MGRTHLGPLFLLYLGIGLTFRGWLSYQEDSQKECQGNMRLWVGFLVFVLLGEFPIFRLAAESVARALPVGSSVPLSREHEPVRRAQAVYVKEERVQLPNGKVVIRRITYIGGNPYRILSAIWWHPDPSKPITGIVVRIGEQRLYAYQGDKVVAMAPVCTGRPGHETPPGLYAVLGKDRNHKSNLYGAFVDSHGRIVDPNADARQKPPPGLHFEPAAMPFFLRLSQEGVGLHGGYLPGHADSHGCIRLPEAFARDIFDLVQVGTPVRIDP